MGTMSWSDDTRCLFCDGKLPLFRKLAQGQFCSKPHQEAYWKEQDQLAVEVLHRTHDALQAYKTAVPIESILGPTAAPAPVPLPAPDVISELQGLQHKPGMNTGIAPVAAKIAAAEPVEYEVHPPAATPSTVREHSSEPVFAQLAGVRALPVILPSRPVAFATAVAELDPQLIVNSPEWSTVLAPKLPWGGLAALAAIHAAFPAAPDASTQAEDFSPVMVRDVAMTLAPRGDVLERMEQEAFPFGESLFALAVHTSASAPSPRNGVEFVAFRGVELSRPAATPILVRPLALAASAEMLGLTGSFPARDWHAPMAGTIASLEPRTPAAAMEHVRMRKPAGADPLADLLASVGCAPLRSLPHSHAVDCLVSPATRPVSYQAFVPIGQVQLPVGTPVSLSQPEVRAQAEGLFRLDLAGKIQPRGDLRLRPGCVAEPLTGEALFPKSKLKPVRAKSAPVVPAAVLEQDPPVRRLATGVADFWNHAPRDLKMLLFAVPLALGLAFHPSLPKVSVQAPGSDAKATTQQFRDVLNTQMTNLRKSMAERAAVGLDENFRTGLDNWMSHSGSTAEWSFDQAGFVQPGRVALYQPSLGLTDYEFQFLGAIDKGALSWVARATDFQNYYVVKLVMLKGGPVPEMGITRYAVINGKPVDRVDTPVTFQARTDSLYRVSMVMEGGHYSLVIQGQMIDSWNEPRLKRGGIGFFTNRGEQSRIGWVQITHQYDMLGRLFAYLAP